MQHTVASFREKARLLSSSSLAACLLPSLVSWTSLNRLAHSRKNNICKLIGRHSSYVVSILYSSWEPIRSLNLSRPIISSSCKNLQWYSFLPTYLVESFLCCFTREQQDGMFAIHVQATILPLTGASDKIKELLFECDLFKITQPAICLPLHEPIQFLGCFWQIQDIRTQSGHLFLDWFSGAMLPIHHRCLKREKSIFGCLVFNTLLSFLLSM